MVWNKLSWNGKEKGIEKIWIENYKYRNSRDRCIINIVKKENRKINKIIESSNKIIIICIIKVYSLFLLRICRKIFEN